MDGNGDLFTAGFAQLQPLLEKALEKERAEHDPERDALCVAAQGIARAAELLAGQYHLVTTNVPYLHRWRQAATLNDFSEAVYSDAKGDLATVFVERCRSLCAYQGTIALVVPQNWLFLTTFRKLREQLLRSCEWNFVARLGPKAFQTPMWDFNVMLLILSSSRPNSTQMIQGIDVSAVDTAVAKDAMLLEGVICTISQKSQLSNPDAAISLEEGQGGPLLAQYAEGLQGISTADYARFGRCFWETATLLSGWQFQQSTVKATIPYGGREHVVWMSEVLRQADAIGAAIRGRAAWAKSAIAISQMGDLPATLTTGECFDANVAIILPKKVEHREAIWAFCSSPEYKVAVRRINQKIAVANATLVKVPFDLERWQKVADEAGPLPEPYSEDPTQWLFKGYPTHSTALLQVAVARLLGYCWPKQDGDDLQEFMDYDGIVPLQAMSGALTAAERLRVLLSRAYGDAWSHVKEEELLASVEFASKSLDLWLRDGFFKQHCRLFHNRPFIWHVWDGRRDGFSALINYHKLDKRLLEKLTYTYVGDWIARQQESVRRGEDGADARLLAIKGLQDKLKLILEGEAPYDVYVRWKQIHEQSVGWEPDLNDGVRLNIRPFMTASVLRAEPNIKWGIDRGKNPDGSARDNDIHLSLKEKLDARKVPV